MKVFLFVLVGIFAIFDFHTAKATKANTCFQYIGPQQERPPQTRDLWDRSWISALDSDIEAAGRLEKQRRADGIPVNPKELASVLGGSLVHLRSTTLSNGLVYVTVHKADGTEIHDDRTYHGLFTCNCGAIHDAPSVSEPPIIKGTDLGGGLLLMSLMSSANSQRTTSHVKKTYHPHGEKEDTTAELNYWIAPGPGSTDLTDLHINYRQRSFITSQRTVIWEDGKTTTEDEARVDGVTEIELDFYKGHLRNFSIKLAHNLSPNRWDSSYDQVVLNFDEVGKLSKILGHSQGNLLNSAWQAGGDAFFAAIKKGQSEWTEYKPTAPQAGLIFQTVTGRDIEDLVGLSFSAVIEIAGAAKLERAVDINSLLQFKSVEKR